MHASASAEDGTEVNDESSMEKRTTRARRGIVVDPIVVETDFTGVSVAKDFFYTKLSPVTYK